jgi:hypothetical protein
VPGEPGLVWAWAFGVRKTIAAAAVKAAYFPAFLIASSREIDSDWSLSIFFLILSVRLIFATI